MLTQGYRPGDDNYERGRPQVVARMKPPPYVILYSTSLHTWEVWRQGRPVGHGSLDACRDAYPDALPVSPDQLRLAEGETR